MARTLQTARKSTGGKAPRKQLRARGEDIRKATIKDHEGNEVALTWERSEWYEEEYGTEDIPPFAWQVYVLDRAASTPGAIKDYKLPESLPNQFHISDGDCEHHWQVYLQPQPSILACVEHQRAELIHRNRNGLWPRMVPKWSTSNDSGYRSFIIVIDSLTWQTDSLILVDFDPMPAGPQTFDPDYQAHLPLVQAKRDWDISGLGDMGKLRARFMDAGHSWTIEDLRRRNNGGFSPALYPAVDPAAHLDADGDDDGLTALDPPQNADDDDQTRSGDAFDKEVLFKDASHFPNIVTASYTDEGGFEVVSARARRGKPMDTEFRMVLYVDRLCPAFAPQALFTCLNRGFIADEAWTLDIVRDQPSLSAACLHHASESSRRSALQTKAREGCMQMILDKVIEDHFPAELVEYVHGLLVPPALPDYSAQGNRLFRDFMLYLDSAHLDTGPFAVYSRPITTPQSRARPQPRLHVDTADKILQVFSHTSWQWLPDEMHILHSFCSPRCLTPDLPLIQIRLEPGEKCSGNVRTGTGSQIPVFIKLEAKEPISIHSSPLFGPSKLWEGSIELHDLTLGVQAPDQTPARLPADGKEGRMQSWGGVPEFDDDWAGLTSPDHIPGETFSFLQLNPGVWRQPDRLRLENYMSFWTSRLRVPWPDGFGFEALDGMDWKSPLVHGHRYALRLKDGVTVPRWVWGPARARRGPYNLPPIPIVMEGEATFVYEEVTEPDPE